MIIIWITYNTIQVKSSGSFWLEKQVWGKVQQATLFWGKTFLNQISFSSVTGECEKYHAIINGRKVSVIDSPGVFDTSLTEDEVINRIKLCIPLSAPGPHVFLVVIQLGRFTDEEAKAVRIIQAVFGEESSNYIMALFTHGDRLEGKNIHTFVRDNPKLLSFVKTCSGRYHVFNNKEQNPERSAAWPDW